MLVQAVFSEGIEIMGTQDDEKIIESAKKRFEELQNQIYGEVRVLLKHAKLNTFDVLKNKNPTYTEVALYLKEYYEIILLIEPLLKTPKYITDDIRCMLEHFETLAKGIDEENIELIGEATNLLDENCRL